MPPPAAAPPLDLLVPDLQPVASGLSAGSSIGGRQRAAKGMRRGRAERALQPSQLAGGDG
jgi:hypothetical protein